MNVLTALSPATQVGADDAGHAPYPESWKTPEGWGRFCAVVETEAARRGLPPMTRADLRRLVYL
jgi:hypothetical protein